MIIERYLFCIEIPETIWRHDIENGGVHTVLDVIDINDALVLLTVFFEWAITSCKEKIISMFGCSNIITPLNRQEFYLTACSIRPIFLDVYQGIKILY